MFFDKKGNKKMRKCEECGSKSHERYSFCPHCGNSFIDARKERDEYGLLGRNDHSGLEDESQFQNMGMLDKLVNSMVNNMMKNLDKQFKHQFKDMEKDLDKAEVKSFPNGIKIKISGPFDNMKNPQQANPRPKRKVQKSPKREINDEQLNKMRSLPRAKAKTLVRRFGDRVVYELATPGVNSADDVFVSKLEEGYEIKAIGSRKVYVNSVPINLPMKRYSIMKNKLQIEFLGEQQPQPGFE